MEKTVELSQTYIAHDKVFKTIVLKEPTYQQTHMDGLGRPFDLQVGPKGPMMLHYPAIVDAYLQRLVVEPGYECIVELNAIDAFRVDRAVCDFFTEPTTSPPLPTGSSSDLASSPPISNE